MIKYLETDRSFALTSTLTIESVQLSNKRRMTNSNASVMKKFEGIWKGEGVGEFPPRVPPFQYVEELTVRPLAKPNTWEIRSQTKNKLTDKPMHVEVGFVRAHPTNETSGKVEFCISHPFGVTEVAEGNYSGDSIEVTCRNEGFTRTSTATPPFVTEGRRLYQITKDEDGTFTMNFLFEMGTTVTPLQSHLVAKYIKIAYHDLCI